MSHQLDPKLYDNEAEQIVLGCMLAKRENLCAAFEKDNIQASDFHFPEHSIIFKALFSFYQRNQPTDLYLLSQHLKEINQLKEAGGIAYLMDLINQAEGSVYFEEYVKVLKIRSYRRALFKYCQEFQLKLLSGTQEEWTIFDPISSVKQQTYTHITNSTASLKSKYAIRSYMAQILEKRDASRLHQQVQLPGISTGYDTLDTVIGGLRKKNLILIAARPGVGKTAFALNMIRHLGLKEHMPVAYFSLEMSCDQIFLRLLSAESKVPSYQIETGQLVEKELKTIEITIDRLLNSHIYINDDCYKLNHLLTQMRALVEQKKVCAIFIDYIGLIEPPKERTNKSYEIGDVTRALKNFANTYQLPIICLAQLNRQADNGIKPQLSMLKDSGNLEQDADSILFLNQPQQIAHLEVLVLKNRHGAVGSCYFEFQKDIGLIQAIVDRKRKKETERVKNSNLFQKYVYTD